MRYSLLASLVLGIVICWAATAEAGQLFPPDNAAGSPTCPAGQMLTWSGNTVICEDVTSNVTANCPAGQYLSGINHGQPVCIDMPAAQSQTVSCPAGQVVTGMNAGQPVCDTASGISATTVVTCTPQGSGFSYNCTATCPSDYHRTGCSVSQGSTYYGSTTQTNIGATPRGTNACSCISSGAAGCYAYCAK